ncbi:MAG: ATP-NAD kinase family protein [Methanobacteriota archaeon]
MTSSRKLGFVINPFAGMGGKVGLKGTDGVVDEAVRRGAVEVAQGRARAFLAKVKELGALAVPEWHAAFADMGENALAEAGADFILDYTSLGDGTTSEDTRLACLAMLSNGCELMVFVGGDGTARDVHDAVRNRVPILGIPSGVKMHSGVFAVSPEAGAELLVEWLEGKAGVQEGELMDLDEEAYRSGEWTVKHYGLAITPFEPSFVQTGKEMFEAAADEDVQEGIANHLAEIVSKAPGTMFILGPGSTVANIAKKLGVEKTLLGVDCYLDGEIVARDVAERDLLAMLDAHPKAKIVVSPIGAQGFIFGRGNLQLSSAVMKRIDLLDVIVAATPAKLAATPLLRVDFDDPELVDSFKRKKYIQVVVGYHTSAMRRMG